MTAFAFYGILTSGLSEALGSYGGRCLIRGDLYDVGAFPALVEGDGLVSGRLWYPNETALAQGVVEELDRVESYYPEDPAGSMYLRQRVLVAGEGAHPVHAYVYFWNSPTAGLRRIPNGRWALSEIVHRRSYAEEYGPLSGTGGES